MTVYFFDNSGSYFIAGYFFDNSGSFDSLSKDISLITHAHMTVY